MSIAQNTALFSLLGTTYGGDGVTTFALPDLRGRTPLHAGQGPGLTLRVQGEAAGTETVTLTQNQIPQHTHLINALTTAGTGLSPASGYLSALPRGTTPLYGTTAPDTTLAATALSSIGGSQPHSIMQPYSVVIYCIAIQGIFPSRN